MLNLTKQEIEFIKENLENGPELIKTLNVNDILDLLGDWIVLNGFDANYDLTDKGRIVQRMYDNIYLNN